MEDHCFAPLPVQNNLSIDQSLRNNEDRLVVVIFNAAGVKESIQISFDTFVRLVRFLPPLTHTHTHTYIYIYIHMCVYMHIEYR